MIAEIQIDDTNLIRMEYPKQYKDGPKYLDIRQWWRYEGEAGDHSKWKPSKKGVTIADNHLEDFVQDLLAIVPSEFHPEHIKPEEPGPEEGPLGL